jgi:hypothetical protein
MAVTLELATERSISSSFSREQYFAQKLDRGFRRDDEMKNF